MRRGQVMHFCRKFAGFCAALSANVAGFREIVDSDLPLIDLAARYEIEGELGRLDPFRVTAGSNPHRSNRGTLDSEFLRMSAREPVNRRLRKSSTSKQT